jgi:excinuclease ABC subunit C
MALSLRQQAAELPLQPGVYLFKNPEGEILYVGKAIRLRERVRSYFASDLGATRGPGLVQMVKDCVQLDHQVTGSEMEALLLEARLIRQHKPRYNIKLRDDKSFSLIRIDLSEPFPPIYISREKDLEELLVRKKRDRSPLNKISQKIDSQEFFGPYISASSVRMALKTIRKIWGFRDCTKSKYDAYAKLGHGCLFATLKLCDAPCANSISQEEYRRNIDQVRAFLRGDREKVLALVQEQMDNASQHERFEQAAKCRDRLQSLVHIQDVAETRRFLGNQQRSDFYVYSPEEDLKIECYDISNISGVYAVGSQIVGIVKGAKLTPISTKEEAKRCFFLDKSKYRKYRIKTVEGISDTDMLKEVLQRRLKRAAPSDLAWSLPDMMIIDGGKGQLSAALEIRQKLEMEEKVNVGSVAKGPTRRRVDLYGSDWSKVPNVQTEEVWQMIAELLREEAHRFAITYYRSVHRKQMLSPKKE